MVLAMGLIYVVLAWLFSSFTQPVVVMLAIPFAMIGMISPFGKNGRTRYSSLGSGPFRSARRSRHPALGSRVSLAGASSGGPQSSAFE